MGLVCARRLLFAALCKLQLLAKRRVDLLQPLDMAALRFVFLLLHTCSVCGVFKLDRERLELLLERRDGRVIVALLTRLHRKRREHCTRERVSDIRTNTEQ